MKRFLACAALCAAAAISFGSETTVTATKPADAVSSAPAKSSVFTLPSGTKCEDVVVGKGAEAKKGNVVFVHYTGKLADGSKFDSSFDHPGKQPLRVNLGAGGVIKGWDEGLVGMKVGGMRILTILPDQGYGEQGFPPVIPPSATLTFETELVDVK
jgi:FKBP-type peptidyl-prolyl cis-trans isomerase